MFLSAPDQQLIILTKLSNASVFENDVSYEHQTKQKVVLCIPHGQCEPNDMAKLSGYQT